MSPTFSSLRLRNYRVYAIGSLVSNIGTWMQNTAQAWLVLVLTDSGTALGITVALQLLPTLLLSPLGGVLADRYPKRTVLRIMQVAMAVPSSVLGVLAVTGLVQVWHVYALAFLFGIGRALEGPSRQAFVAEMVGREDLGNAVALNSASFNSGRLIGPGLAGLMIAGFGAGAVGTGWVILINAVSYAASFVALQMLDTSRLQPSVMVTQRRRAVRDGIGYIRSRPDLVLVLSCMFFLGGFGMNFQVTSALMATDEFGHGAGEYGVLGSLLAIGSLSGALMAARRAVPRLRFILLSGAAFAVLQIASGLMPTFITYALTLPLIGLTIMTMATTANALIQLTTTPQMRGRVAALYIMVFIGSVPFAAPIVGWLSQEHGARIALVATGLLAGVGITVTFVWYLHQLGLGRSDLREAARNLKWRDVRRSERVRARRASSADEPSRTAIS